MNSAIIKIKSMTFEEVRYDFPLYRSLPNIYSKLFLNGKKCSTCNRHYQKYYNQIKNHSEMDKNTERKEVTFEVVDGLKMKKNKSYPLTRTSSAKMPHIVIGLLSDEKATQYLNEGLISEKHFKKLPENYLKAKKVKEAKEKEANKVKK